MKITLANAMVKTKQAHTLKREQYNLQNKIQKIV